MERFWSKVDVRGPNECWEWQAGRDDEGYGFFQLNGRQVRAHRLAWELGQEESLGSRCALHSCDNPPCCNPAHVFPGTNAENTADKLAKGRHARGSLSARAALNELQVLGIMARWLQGIGHIKIAREFGVKRSQVPNIVYGRRWCHLFRPDSLDGGAAD